MQKKIFAVLAAATALASSSPVFAQAKTAAAVVVVVDRGRIIGECNACKAANAALKTQADQIQARGQALATPIQTEGTALQTAIDALQGKQPDAALKARITAFQQRQQAAEVEIQNRKQTFQRNQAYIGQQVLAKLNPIVTAAMKAHGANLAIDPDAIIAYEPAIEITNEVLATPL